MRLELKKEIDKGKLLIEIINRLTERIKTYENQVKENYINNLYKYQKPAMFKSKDNTLFLGKIIGVTLKGNLQIELENEKIKTFNFKEIVYL